MTHDPITEFLQYLHGPLDQEEVLYVAAADDPELNHEVGTLEEAAALAREWKDRGVFCSSGTFAASTSRKRDHLLSIPAIQFDQDLKDRLIFEGIEPKEADRKIRQCSPEILEKLCSRHREWIVDALSSIGLEPSAITFTGGGHQTSLLIDFLDTKEVARIVNVQKALVAKLNDVAGWELCDPSASDAGTRYIRVAGTANTKSDPPRWARVVQNGGCTYTLEQLEEAVGQQSEEKQETASEEAGNQEEASVQVVWVLLPYWTKGKRHELALSLCGYLSKADWSWSKVKACLVAIARQANDEELQRRLKDLQSTFQRFAKGQEVRGYTALAKILTAEAMQKLEAAVGGQMGIEDDLESEEEEPSSIAAETVNVEPFPIDALPKALKNFVEATAKALGCPTDFVAVPALVAAGAAIGGGCELELKRGWREGANLYAVCIGDPGVKKSPAQDKALTPTFTYQQQAKARYLEERKTYDRAFTQYELDLRKWEQDAKKGRVNAQDKPQPPPEPAMVELYVTDATKEAIGDALEKNPAGVLYTNDEVSAWVQSFNQYRNGKGADRQFWLSGWNRAQIKVNRKSRKEPQVLEKPFLAVSGGIQPEILPMLADEKGREDGLIHRLLCAFPTPLPLTRSDDEVDEDITAAYCTLFERLWSLRQPVSEKREPRVFRLTPAAKEKFDDFRDSHYAEQDETFPSVLRGPWAKREAYCARLTLIIHCCRLVMKETTSQDVDEESLSSAWTLVDYFKSHDRKVHACLRATPQDRRAEAAVEWIKRHGGKATSRDLQMYRVANIKTASEAKKFLRELEDRGYGKNEKKGKREIFTLAESAKQEK